MIKEPVRGVVIVIVIFVIVRKKHAMNVKGDTISVIIHVFLVILHVLNV